MTRDLFDYPNHPGFKEPTTSRDAAVAVAPRVESLQSQILRAITSAGPDGLTPDECAQSLAQTVLAVRPRFTELGPKHMNMIVKTGERRANASGLMAAAWRARGK